MMDEDKCAIPLEELQVRQTLVPPALGFAVLPMDRISDSESMFPYATAYSVCLIGLMPASFFGSCCITNKSLFGVRESFRGQSNHSFCVADDLDWHPCHAAPALTNPDKFYGAQILWGQGELFAE